jgi:hypothetical protein
MRLIRNIKFKFRKKWSKFHNTPTTIVMTSTHSSVASIFRIALKNKNSELICIPNDEKRIVKMEKYDLYIKLEKFNISLTNSQYNYMIEIPYTLYEKLTIMFDRKINTKYQEEEKLINSQIEIGIKNVLKLVTKTK